MSRKEFTFRLGRTVFKEVLIQKTWRSEVIKRLYLVKTRFGEFMVYYFDICACSTCFVHLLNNTLAVAKPDRRLVMQMQIFQCL